MSDVNSKVLELKFGGLVYIRQFAKCSLTYLTYSNVAEVIYHCISSSYVCTLS